MASNARFVKAPSFTTESATHFFWSTKIRSDSCDSPDFCQKIGQTLFFHFQWESKGHRTEKHWTERFLKDWICGMYIFEHYSIELAPKLQSRCTSWRCMVPIAKTVGTWRVAAKKLLGLGRSPQALAVKMWLAALWTHFYETLDVASLTWYSRRRDFVVHVFFLIPGFPGWWNMIFPDAISHMMWLCKIWYSRCFPSKWQVKG